VAVLLDNFEDAVKIMRTIGSSGTPDRDNYREWPLFKEFRKTPLFLQTFEEIFVDKFIYKSNSINASIFGSLDTEEADET
jgi:hypothetical protein